ncbi:hypothetical protein DRP04_03790 [Archaeoglobales archaeon]|nr:MAG: hypothetical protein DRP04_03790 [Archaeoglobales archaeon]
MPSPTIQQLHKSYWQGCKYLDRLYRTVTISGHKFGVTSEYNTICPFTLLYDGAIYPSGYKKTEFETYQYVHSCTLDYMVVTKVEFKEPINCSIWVSYDRQRIKNGSFTIRKYISEGYDEPAFWNVEKKNVDVSLVTKYYTIIVPGPCPEPSATTFGPYSLLLSGVLVDGATSWARVSQRLSILPDTEYVFSFDATLLSFPSGRLKVRLAGYDYSGNYVGDLVSIDLPRLGTCDWQYFERRFRSLPETPQAEVIIEVVEGPTSSEEAWLAILDNFYLSESPRSLSAFNRLLAQIESYDGDKPGTIYFNGERVWTDITKNNIPRNALERSVSLYGMPSFRSAIRHGVQNCKFFYENTSIHPDWSNRAEMLQKTRDAWGYTWDIYHPLFRASDDYPDYFMFDADVIFHDCDVWASTPITTTFYPYWSKVCINKQAALDGLIIKNPYYPALLAIHIMNKYNDPFVKVPSIYGTSGTPGWVSAYDLLFEELNIVTTEIYLNPTIERIDPDKGWHRGNGVYSVYAAACVMAALAEIGYGFYSLMPRADADRARDYADRIAYTLIRNQWGFPFTDPFVFKHEDLGDVSIPEATGGFLVLTIYDAEGNPISTSRKDWLTEFTDMFGMSPETPQVLPVNQETTWVCLRTLQIYEWYKYKGGENKGAFPAILMPADVNGDGRVDVEDLKLIAQTIEKGEYYPLADINGDGKVDMEDFNLVKQALRTPMKGIFWWPTLSPEIQVEVSTL